MRKPRILISGVQENRSNYETAIRIAGGEPLSFYCPSLQIPSEGLLLAGGGDIAPCILGEEDMGSRDIDLERDYAEFALVKEFASKNKPILGICRGHQVVNVALGGTLIQDIGFGLEQFHAPTQGSREDVHHLICTNEESKMADFYGSKVIVNSWHHQAINRPGKSFLVSAWSESGLIEATEHEYLPIFTVQFHPERMHALEQCPERGDGRMIFTWLIEACRQLWG